MKNSFFEVLARLFGVNQYGPYGSFGARPVGVFKINSKTIVDRQGCAHGNYELVGNTAGNRHHYERCGRCGELIRKQGRLL